MTVALTTEACFSKQKHGTMPPTYDAPMTAGSHTSPSLPAPEVPRGVMARVVLLAKDIKLSHTVFAMPFALLAMVLASASASVPGATGLAKLPDAATIVLIILCMVLARTMAMAINRWADARIDATNPRTQGRAIPSGRLSPTFMLSVAIGCAFAFILAAAGFWLLDDNAWPVLLSPVVLAFLAGYSFTKRFTWLCHLYLGMALAISPVAAAVAIAPGFLAYPDAWLLSGMVMCWVAGFDIIYALQDVDNFSKLGATRFDA